MKTAIMCGPETAPPVLAAYEATIVEVRNSEIIKDKNRDIGNATLLFDKADPNGNATMVFDIDDGRNSSSAFMVGQR